MHLKAHRFFAMVALKGSFSAAARHFQVPASSVSRFIAALEREVGQQLLYRSTRAVKLTDAGERYYLQIREVLELLDAADEEVSGKGGDIGGLVRINAPMVFGQRHLSPWLGELCRRYPKLQLDIQQTDTYVDPLQDGTDLLFRIGVLNDSGMQARIFAPQRFRIAASPAYLARHGTPKHPDELVNHQCLAYKGITGQQRWFFRRDGGDWTPYSVKGPITGNHADTLTHAAEQGLGLVVFPSWLIGEGLRAGTLQAVLSDYEVATTLEPQQIAALWPGSRRLSLKVRTVIDYFVECFGAVPYWDR